MSMNNYSVRRCTASFGGKPVDAGRADGAFVKIEKATKRFGIKAGVDGTATRYEMGSNVHKVTLILMQGSVSNDFLSGVHLGDVLAGNGLGIAPLQIKDLNGTSLLVDPEAFIEDLPDEEYSEEPGTREWVFWCPDPLRNVGSN